MNWRSFALGVLAVIVSIVLLVGGVLAVFGLPTGVFFTPTETGAAAGLDADEVEYEVVAEDLDVPCEVIPLGDGQYLVTE